MTLTARLDPELESFARARVADGAYADLDEAVGAGVRLLMEEQEERKHAFDAMIAEVLRETGEKGALSAEDVLARFDRIVEAGKR